MRKNYKIKFFRKVQLHLLKFKLQIILKNKNDLNIKYTIIY